MNEYVIAHERACCCLTDGFATDGFFANDDCRFCGALNGYNMPLFIEDTDIGNKSEQRIAGHLSCVIEKNPWYADLTWTVAS